MTGVDTDLATLRRRLRHFSSDAMPALARVEAELARLRKVEDDFKHLSSEFNYESWRGDHLVYESEWAAFNEWQRNGKEQMARLREQRDAAEKACEKAVRERRSLEVKEDDWHRAYEAADTRCARLQQALDPETLARTFHATYERLAPEYGYETRRESAVPWEQVPEANRSLMVAVAKEIAREALAGPDTPADNCPECGSGILNGEHIANYPCSRRDTPADSVERCEICGERGNIDGKEDGWFIPEGDRQCGVVHMDARATCMKRRGHGGSHGTAQGTWIDGPWCEYPAGSQEES